MNKNWNICYTTWLLTWWEIPPVWTYLLIAFSFSTQMYRWQEFSFLKSKIWMWRYWESSDFFFLSMFNSETSAKTLFLSLPFCVIYKRIAIWRDKHNTGRHSISSGDCFRNMKSSFVNCCLWRSNLNSKICEWFLKCSTDHKVFLTVSCCVWKLYAPVLWQKLSAIHSSRTKKTP